MYPTNLKFLEWLPDNLAERGHTHTHTHTYIYIYIYLYLFIYTPCICSSDLQRTAVNCYKFASAEFCRNSYPVTPFLTKQECVIFMATQCNIIMNSLSLWQSTNLERYSIFLLVSVHVHIISQPSLIFSLTHP